MASRGSCLAVRRVCSPFAFILCVPDVIVILCHLITFNSPKLKQYSDRQAVVSLHKESAQPTRLRQPGNCFRLIIVVAEEGTLPTKFFTSVAPSYPKTSKKENRIGAGRRRTEGRELHQLEPITSSYVQCSTSLNFDFHRILKKHHWFRNPAGRKFCGKGL